MEPAVAGPDASIPNVVHAWAKSGDLVLWVLRRPLQKEIDYATSIGDLDAVRRLTEIRDAAIAKIREEWYG